MLLSAVDHPADGSNGAGGESASGNWEGEDGGKGGLGGPTLPGTYRYVNQQYAKEASESPGVRLVAHAVV